MADWPRETDELLNTIYITMTKTSKTLFSRACDILPGGVNSPVRAFQRVGGAPVFFERGEGAYLYDAEGQRYIDYIGSWDQ